MAAIGVVAAVVPPAVYSLPARLVPAARVGLAFGFITALSNLGTVIGPALAGAIRDATPAWPATWGALAVIAVGSAVAAALVRPAARRLTPLLLDRDLDHLDRRLRPVAGAGRRRLDALDHVHALGHAPEHRVLRRARA